MRSILRSTTAAVAGVSLLLATTAVAQTLPSPEQMTGLKDRQCVRLLRMLAEAPEAPAAVTEAEAALKGADGACDGLSGVWSEVDPSLLNDEASKLLSAAMRQAGIVVAEGGEAPAAPAAIGSQDPAAVAALERAQAEAQAAEEAAREAERAAAEAAAREAEEAAAAAEAEQKAAEEAAAQTERERRLAAAAERAAAQALPIPREIARLEDRQCVRLLQSVGGADGAPQSVVDAAAGISGSEGACRTLARVWRDVTPELLDDDATQLLAAAMRQSGVDVTAAELAAEGAGAAALQGGAAAETTTETVTEDTARSSDEDFSEAAPSGDSGLSTLEKALIVGAGALVAGAIVSNNRKVISTTPDRVVVEQADGQLQVLKDDNALLRQPGSEVATQTFGDGSTRSVVTREDGVQIVTIRDAELRVLKRVRIDVDGTETVLIDDTAPIAPVEIALLPDPVPEAATLDTTDADALRAALAARNTAGRTFTLAQVRDFDRVRKLAPAISVDNITFATGSAAIRPSEAEELSVLGRVIADAVARDPSEIFLVEGHTDATGGAGMNLLLSDRRAESVALALTEYFSVPPENLVVQGYGESDLRIPTQESEVLNRRAVVRRVTPLLRD